MPLGMFYFDPLYLVIMIPALLLAMFAQFRVKSAYGQYSRVRNARNIPGEEAAAYLLRQAGLAGAVGVKGTPGDLTDHYDPRDKNLYLSVGVAQTPSVASLGIVAHEIGHAVQDAEAYAPLRFRSAIVPAVSLGSNLGYILFLIGFFLAAYTNSAFGSTLIYLGILFFSGSVVFSLATLPVEFNASARALDMLRRSALVGPGEVDSAKKVLDAAAFTYVAGAASAILNLLYYVLLAGRVTGRRND